MGQRDQPLSPVSPGGRSKTLSPRRSPRKGVRQRAYTLLLPLIGLVGMTVILSGSNLLNQTRDTMDRLASDPQSAVRMVRKPARTMLNKPSKKDGGVGGSVQVTSARLMVDRNGTGRVLEGVFITGQEKQCEGGGDSCRKKEYSSSRMQDGSARIGLPPSEEVGMGEGRVLSSDGSQRKSWEGLRQLSEEENKRPFEHAGLLVDGDTVVFVQRLQSEMEDSQEDTEDNADAVTAYGSMNQIEGTSSSSCSPEAANSSSTGDLQSPAGGCTPNSSSSSSPSVGSSRPEDARLSFDLGKRISRLSRWYQWNETNPPELSGALEGRALSGNGNFTQMVARGGEQEEGEPGALPLWSLGIAELEHGGTNGTWLDISGPNGDTHIRVYRAWLTRDHFLGLFSLLFLALHSNATAAALSTPQLLCQVGRNSAPMTASSPGGVASALLLLHCPLAPTFSDQLAQARPSSRGDAQWGPNTVLLEPTTVLPVTLSLSERSQNGTGEKGSPTGVAQASFTLKPLASLIRQPRYSLAACVGPIESNFSRGDWVGFLEYHAEVVGVQHFVVYVPAEQRGVLQDYEHERMVTVVQYDRADVPRGGAGRIESDAGASDWRSLARNQCLWHTRGLAHWTLFLDSPAAYVQIGGRFGHSFGNWSASLRNDVAIVELRTHWNAEPANLSSLPANQSPLPFERCIVPVAPPPPGAPNGRALFAAGSKVRYIGRLPTLDQMTPGKALKHRVGRVTEILAQECDRRAAREGSVNGTGKDGTQSGSLERVLGERETSRNRRR